MARDDELRERFVDAALRLIADEGAGALTVRRVADAAGSSTMGVYSRFGGRTGILEAVYARGFEMLLDALAAVPTNGDADERLVALADAYREFAREHPARYAFMFEHPLPDFHPSDDARAVALRSTFPLFVDAIAAVSARRGRADDDHRRTAYLVWATMHGLVSLELSNAARRPRPGWLIDPRDDIGDRAYRAGLDAVLRGLGISGG